MKHDGAVVGFRGCCAVLTRFCQGAVVVLGVKIQACNNCKYIISLCMTITIQLYLYYVKLRNSITSTLVHNKTVQNIGMYPESPLDGIPTGRNPHWTESPPNFMQWGFRALVPGIPTGRNPHSSAHIAFTCAVI